MLSDYRTFSTTSRRQGHPREVVSGGSPSAKVRVDGQESHRRPGPGASQHKVTKPVGTLDRVNAAIVHRQFTSLSGEICFAGIEFLLQ